MSDNTALLLAGCAFLAVIGGLGLVLIIVGLRQGWGWLKGLPLGMVGLDGDTTEDDIPTTPRFRRRRVVVKQITQDLDFEAAVARHAQEETPSAASTTTTAAHTADFPLPQMPSQRQRRRRDRNQDEVFGGLLDEDGDGDLDFLA